MVEKHFHTNEKVSTNSFGRADIYPPLLAQSLENQGINYTITDWDNKTCEVSGYSGEPTNIVIPSQVAYENENYTVTAIGDDAFSECTSLVSIELPNSLISIGESAFSNCTSLTSIELPEDITSIEFRAFEGCTSLTSINLPESITTIGNKAFCLCSSLTSIELPKKITSIGNSLFLGCSSLTSIELPDGVTSIGYSAFQGCSSLASIYLPDGIISIGSQAFQETALGSCAIPPSVEEIGSNVFESCWSLSRLAYPNTLNMDEYSWVTLIPYDPEGAKVDDNGCLYGDNGETLLFVPTGDMEEFAIPEGVKTITSSAFSGCNIKSLTIPSTIETVEANAFATNTFQQVNLTNWTKWYANAKLGNLEANPYRNCGAYAGGLRIVNPPLEEGLVEISDYINAGVTFDGELILPSTLKKIGAYAFSSQKDLYYVEFNEGLEEIGDAAFSGCETLTFEGLPSSLTKIGRFAFHGCATQTSITLPENITSIGREAFADMTGLKKAVLFSKLTEVPDSLCAGCNKLENLYLPKLATRIGRSAFEDTAIEEVILPQQLETIGTHAFAKYSERGAGALYKVNFPESLQVIESGAFMNQNFRILELNEGLKTIGGGAFEGNNNLTTVNFPSTIEYIGGRAFATYDWGRNINRVILPPALTELAQSAFSNISVGEFETGDGLTAIEPWSLGMPKILTIGSGVKTIADGAINFSDLKVLRMKGKTPPTVTAAFNVTEEQIDNLTFIVPDGAKNAYERNPRWKVFNIVEESESDVTVYVDGTFSVAEEVRMQSGIMPSLVTKLKVTGTLADSDWRLINENMVSLIWLDLSGISNTEIPAGAFENKSMLTEIILPARLTKIGNNAFSGCSMLDTPELPETLETIGGNAFAGCSRLSISVLPDALQFMGYGSFANCTSLRSITAGPNMVLDTSAAGWNFQGCTALEFVDFGRTPIEQIPWATFQGCSSLTNIILPPNLKYIDSEVFANTALESIELPATVESIGNNAFQGTKLRAVTIPEGVSDIASQTFADCPRLINVNFPGSLKTIGTNAMQNSTRVSGLSCPSVEAPSAETGAFATLSARKCSLTVPRQSYRAYLSAPQWGIFANLINSLNVTVPENAVLTAVDEEEYQEIVEEEALIAEAEAPIEEEEEPEENEDENGEDENENNPAPSRAKIRQAARETLTTTGRNYAQLFDGATLGSPKTAMGTRIFINLKENTKLKSVFYNNKDVTDQVEDYSLLLPQNAMGTLEIVTEAILTGIEDVVSTTSGSIAADAECVVFDTTGRFVTSGLRCELESTLAPGLYILKSGALTEKIAVK